eukprot:EST41923.1 Hypothetical protein SS50377_18227 [Spironucleus salmonicida]
MVVILVSIRVGSGTDAYAETAQASFQGVGQQRPKSRQQILANSKVARSEFNLQVDSIEDVIKPCKNLLNPVKISLRTQFINVELETKNWAKPHGRVSQRPKILTGAIN